MHIKRTLASSDYGISESLNPEGNVAILRMGNVSDGSVSMDELKFVDAVPEELLLLDGDLLYNRTNSLELIGKVGLFSAPPESGLVSFASYLVRMRTNAKATTRYLSYLLNTASVLAEARSLAFVAIGQCNLNPTRYGAIHIPLPPADEQRQITDFLDEKTRQIGTLLTKSRRMIDLLKERRAALISAAVTGKIDVREAV
jgi:type I restriction enzyme S subunit